MAKSTHISLIHDFDFNVNKVYSGVMSGVQEVEFQDIKTGDQLIFKFSGDQKLQVFF